MELKLPVLLENGRFVTDFGFVVPHNPVKERHNKNHILFAALPVPLRELAVS